MRIVVFSWEYPPRIIGKLSEQVSAFAKQLVKNKVETHIVTYHDFLIGAVKEENGVIIVRVTNPVRTHTSFLTWVLTLNQEVEREAANIYYEANNKIDFIDVHDWHFIPAAVTLKKGLGIPFVYSVESLEDHRSPRMSLPLNLAIKSIEQLGFYESEKVIVKSEWMRDEIVRIINIPIEKIKVVLPNAGSWMKAFLE